MMFPISYDLKEFVKVSTNGDWSLYLSRPIRVIDQGALLVNEVTKEQLQCRAELIERNGKKYFKVMNYVDPVAYIQISFKKVFKLR